VQNFIKSIIWHRKIINYQFLLKWQSFDIS